MTAIRSQTTHSSADVFESVFGGTEALVYRCKNDDDYTMEFMAGQVTRICGYEIEEILGNRVVSWVGLTLEEDVERIFSEVDDAIDKGESWDVIYRLMRKDGDIAWVRERGNAVHDADGQLIYLEGIIVSATAETALRDEVKKTLLETQAHNAEILAIAEGILRSVRTLSILAVNARIEAARSGSAGAGFGVIASEINALASDNNRMAQLMADKLGGTRKT